MRERLINWFIKITKADTNKISDGYHTFEELYDHRIALWIYICSDWRRSAAWKTQKHSDGSIWDGWFILGLFDEPGIQITYHLPISYWDTLKEIKTLDRAPEWDGHTPEEAKNRILRMAQAPLPS